MTGHNGPRTSGNERTPTIASLAKAVGGTETVIEQNGLYYRVHTFTDVGEDTLEVTRGGEVEYLVVAGGGGTTPSGCSGGTGAGAGGLLKNVKDENNNNIPLTLDSKNYAVGVGNGGVAGVWDGESFTVMPTNGEDSYIDDILVAIGGGRGVTRDDVGISGGSGSGGGINGRDGGSGIEGQGNDGGRGVRLTLSGTSNCGTWTNGGGGGAGEPGITPSGTIRGDVPENDVITGLGGNGLQSSISGTLEWYAGGGTAGRNSSPFNFPIGDPRIEVYGSGLQSNLVGGLGGGGEGNRAFGGGQGGDATPNTGGGAGGGPRTRPDRVSIGGNGGSGIVIVRYRITKTEFDEFV